MPLVRFQVRNEYGLGHPELYTEANREDPKAVLDGVAVAGLVGILRQLGDLAEFAGEVFHGLQEQVMTTASRSHKLMVRVQHIEAALPSLERAVLAQTSHIHFAYTAGSEWHPNIRRKQNHFIYNDLPQFIMDSYEECHDPPRLHLLDKFDTGGPGSCLKRYSDPTFFKRVSGNSDEASAEKAQRDKKARKSKKKRISLRNGEISRGTSISNRSGRMQFTSPIVNGQTSPRTVSTADMTLKSDPGVYSNSFDSRTGSGYIECVFDLSSSVQPEEQELKESSSRMMPDNDTLESVSPEQSGVVDYNIPHISSQEKIAPSSSCVTWDEKTEIVESKLQDHDRDEAPEMLPTNSDLDTQNIGAANGRNIDQMNILFDDNNSPKSLSSGNQLDGIESEPDNYMDALNTIESESENDLDCQTKREVEQYSYNVDNEETENGVHGHMAHTSDHDPSNIDTSTAPDISSSKGMSCNLPNSLPSKSFVHEQKPEISGVCSDSDPSPGIDFSAKADILDGSKVESIISDPSSSGSRISNLRDSSGDKSISSFCESQESHAEFSGVNSIQFWTNGGLLGLEPSKPPDFSVSNAVSQNSVAKDDSVGPQNHTFMLKGGGQKGKLGTSVENTESVEKVPSSKCSTSCHDDQENGFFTEKTSQVVPPSHSDAKPLISGDFHHSNRFSPTYWGGLNLARVVAPATELQVDPDAKAPSTAANQENDENSSRVFGLGHRLLVNGFHRKVSSVQDGNSEPASPLKAGLLEQSSGQHNAAYQTTPETTFKEQFCCGSTIDSPTSSPPLEHMKISFHPTDGFETSKLKLKFPDGSHSRERTRDMFPSFQLVPEPDIPLHDIGTESDDDTFCRSSPYLSDDCLSHHSELNSEDWESGEGPGSKDHELYDALCRISSMESVSSSLQLGGTGNNGIHNDSGKTVLIENGAEPSLSGSLLDLPSFEAMNPLLQGETKNGSDQKNPPELQNHKEPSPPPPPPPLPPVEWLVLTPHTDVSEGQQHDASEAINHEFDNKLLGSTVFQQPTPTPCNQQPTNEEAVVLKTKSKQEDQQKLNGKSEANQASNGKGMDEKEDFLHQIRTKSFNLRRTETARPTFTQGSATSVKVTAILEKANAIRQAVGSDDGEDDDNWSDT